MPKISSSKIKKIKAKLDSNQQKQWIKSIEEMDAFYADLRDYLSKVDTIRAEKLLTANPTFAALRRAAGVE